MFCKYCGYEYQNENVRFCPSCGRSLENEVIVVENHKKLHQSSSKWCINKCHH